jgi:hypothetical protein
VIDILREIYRELKVMPRLETRTELKIFQLALELVAFALGLG